MDTVKVKEFKVPKILKDLIDWDIDQYLVGNHIVAVFL